VLLDKTIRLGIQDGAKLRGPSANKCQTVARISHHVGVMKFDFIITNLCRACMKE